MGGKEVARTVPTFQARADWGYLLRQLGSGDGMAPRDKKFSIPPCCRQIEGMCGWDAWEGATTDSRPQGGGQRQKSQFGSHQMQWESKDATHYTKKKKNLIKQPLQRQKIFCHLHGLYYTEVFFGAELMLPLSTLASCNFTPSGTHTKQAQCPPKSRVVTYAKRSRPCR